ncbi:MAG: NADH-quinone oxidoreductase subunit H [Deltaproteobacteria bacterium]|nr:NADH-quinone oxidoreductase subunit H [Deltaproteobacteria bacterium]
MELNELYISLLIGALKALLGITFLLALAAVNTWFERKVSALIQNRTGANRASLFGMDLAGLVNTLVCDPLKAFLKEDWVPKGVSQFMHCLPVFFAVFPVLLCIAAIPFAPPLTALGLEISLQVTNLNAGLLFVFAFGSLAVLGVLLAGYVSNNKFALFGGLRAVAQMVSYEVVLGLSALSMLIIYRSLDLQDMVLAQSGTFYGLPNWGIFLNPLAFFIFFTAMMAETKRAPFDLPESESELVAGYLTEYSGMKFLLFWLSEFAEIVICACLVSIIFLGGWQLPYFDITTITSDWGGVLPDWFNRMNFQWAPLLGAGIFGLKVTAMCVLQIIIRWTLPRFRYDQLMSFCWKILFSLCILNLVGTAILMLSGGYNIWEA